MASLRAAVIVPALGVGLACTAILNPRDDVQRCGSQTDCEESGDERYEVVCVFPEDSNLDSTEVDKICVAQEKSISCDPMSYLGIEDHPLIAALDANDGSRYVCGMDQLGLQGCAPRNDGTCDAGLTTNRNGVCDVEGGDAVNIASNPDLTDRGKDILDQFCRSFFCDEEYVCDEDFVCVRCDGNDFANDGCGTVFQPGAPSCIYTDPEDTCDAPNSSTTEPNFGACP